ncbi:MAG: penicillin acylase family protein, partial [Gammaproteobacteria bacterium]|nr:penicillin acylase family protein [Gammaproteobacteria bacterium]
MLKKIGIALIALLLVIILAAVAGIAWLSESNIPDRDRDIGDAAVLAMLNDEVRVKRDRQGVPYIYAQTLADALRVQGFVTAQDRLSQMLLTRELIHGRLSEQIGEAGLRSDTLVRIMGLSRMGSVWAAQLESPSRELHEWFLEGVNAYIATQADEFPLAVRISGEPPAPFTLDDFTTQYLFLAFNSTGNWRTEVLSQALVDHLGAGKAAEISMLTVNPDDESEWASDYSLAENRMPESDPASFPELPEPSDGSNSWATSARRSAGGAPIVANDPHIDVRRLPSIWHPV